MGRAGGGGAGAAAEESAAAAEESAAAAEESAAAATVGASMDRRAATNSDAAAGDAAKCNVRKGRGEGVKGNDERRVSSGIDGGRSKESRGGATPLAVGVDLNGLGVDLNGLGVDLNGVGVACCASAVLGEVRGALGGAMHCGLLSFSSSSMWQRRGVESFKSLAPNGDLNGDPDGEIAGERRGQQLRPSGVRLWMASACRE